jgi:predicted dehydrogenase
MVRDGEIGRLSQIVVEMGGPRSMLFRNHTHAIDLVGFLVDSEPLWVWSELEPGFEDYGIAYAGDGGNDPATEPGGNYYIAYANGVRAYLTGFKDTVGLDTGVTLTGGDGRILVDLEGVRLHSVQHTDIRTKPGVVTVRPIKPHWTHAGMQAGLQDVIDSLDAGRQPSSPPESARTTVALIQAILMSQARGNVKVDLEELAPVTTPAR